MFKNALIIVLTFALCISSTFIAGCQSDAQTGAVVGGAVGAGAGQAIGRDTKSTLIGAAIGAGAGYVIGNQQDKKKAQTQDDLNIVTVNITNSNGSVTPVKLKKQGAGYVGPKGEVYDHLPTEAELKPVYGF
jgi:outer membrane lipoprotein SlyB